MPDGINSVVLGDPASFAAEHSEREPQIVFVKPITDKAAQTNLLISTTRGYQASLLLISQGEAQKVQPNVDFEMRYRPAGRFIIEPSSPSLSVAQTIALSANDRIPEKPTISAASGPNAAASDGADKSRVQTVSLNLGNSAAATTSEPSGIRTAPQNPDTTLGLDSLLERQQRAPLPALYGEKPGVSPPGKQILKAGVSEVIDHGPEVVVLFSVLNVQNHAVELMPPQVQLGGKVKKGAIVHHTVWSNSEQLAKSRFSPYDRDDRLGIPSRTSR